MLSITSSQLDALLLAWVYPLMRILGLMATAPAFSNQAVPRRIRLVIGVALALAMTASLPPTPDVQPGSWLGIGVLIQQVLIGIAMGLTMRIILSAIDVAGEIIGLQMGLSFATFFDPNTSAQTAVLAELLSLLTALTFLVMNGHLLLIDALARSFELLPIGGSALGDGGWRALARLGSVVFSTGVLISLPIIAALLVTNIALAVLTRAAPQLNIFAIGFPITSTVGFLVLMFSLDAMAPVLQQLFDTGFDHIGTLFQSWASLPIK